MSASPSVQSRFGISVAANAVRAALGFLGGLLLARGLQPESYGNFAFLLGSFTALRSFLDMGSSNAFFTFIAQKRRGRHFFLSYFAWLTLQFAVTALLIALVLPHGLIQKIWLGQPRPAILLAFAACFLQQQAWTTVNQIAESARRTWWVQGVNIAIGAAHVALIGLLWFWKAVSLSTVFWIMIAEYLVALAFVVRYFPARQGAGGSPVEDRFSFDEMARDYARYCKPLFFNTCLIFVLEFCDKWLLQRFAGASQQGYFQIASQFAAVSLLATSSVLNIFWKEIAEGWAQGDLQRVAVLYRRVNRGLVMLGAITSGFLVPWTREIVLFFLGPAYLSAVPVLTVMFLYPVHQAMGQIGSVMLLATENTAAYTRIGIAISLCFFPVSYFVQAPAGFYPVPGLGLGAVGMAYKTVLINIISVNVMAYFIARICRWRYDWLFQVVGISSVLGLGYMVKIPVSMIFGVPELVPGPTFIPPVVVALALYLGCVAVLIWNLSWLVGMEKSELKGYARLFVAKLGFGTQG